MRSFHVFGLCCAAMLMLSGCSHGSAVPPPFDTVTPLEDIAWTQECFSGKTFVVYGDSITFGARVSSKRSLYIQRLSEHCGFSYKSFAVSGSTLAHGNDAQEKNGSGVQYVFENSDYNRQADYALIFYGANDFSHNVPLGTGTQTADTYSAVSAYKDGIRYVYETLKSCNENIGIIFVTPLYRADIEVNGIGLRMTDYDDAVREMCAKLGCYYVDIADLFDSENFGEDSPYTPGKLHPNDEGHRVMYEAMLERGIVNPTKQS